MILIQGLRDSPMVWHNDNSSQFDGKNSIPATRPRKRKCIFSYFINWFHEKMGAKILFLKIKIESPRRGGHSKKTKAPWDFPWSLGKIKNTYLHLIKWFPNRVRRMMWLLLYGQTTVSSSGLKFDLPFLQGPGTKSNGIVSSKNLEMKTWIIQSKNSSFRFSKLLDW